MLAEEPVVTVGVVRARVVNDFAGEPYVAVEPS
jgi:hypothetical protein